MFAKLVSTFNLIFSHGWDFFRPRKKLGMVSFVILSGLIISAWFIFTPAAHASSFGDDLMNFFASILLALAGFCIKLTFFVLKFVIEVAGYNGFIDSPAVTVGWVMIRDMTNMFFVVVLLIIAFGTILGLEQYEYKKLLVKMLLAAVIVNFSRVICGLIIDVAQIIMVTFVNGIAATASGNLVNMFQVDQIFALGAGQDVGATASVTFIAGVAALVFSAMMLMVMLAFLFLIVARMAMLWVLIVLSPLAFVLNVLPQTEKYASEWWGQFGSNVVSGPVIAFFLWLSFVTVGSGSIHDDIVKHNALQKDQLLQSGTAEEETVGITKVMSWDRMANFIIAIAMLMAGAKMAQELGVAGGSMMGSAGELGKKVAMYASGLQAARWTAGKVGQGAKAAGKFALMKAPIVGGDEWTRRGRRIKAAASKWYSKKWVEPRLLQAGKNINTAFGKEKADISKESKNAQDLVARRDAALAEAKKGPTLGVDTLEKDQEMEEALQAQLRTQGKSPEEIEAAVKKMTEERDAARKAEFAKQKKAEADVYGKQLEGAGYDVDTSKDGKTELKKAFAPNQRALARMALWFAPSAFKEEYTGDAEKGAELAHEQLEHLVSTSKTPIGKFKTAAEARLHELEETGSKIKAEKIQTVLEKMRGTSGDIARALKGGKTLDELEKSGQFTGSQIFDYQRGKRGLEAGEKADLVKHTLHAEEEEHRLEEKKKLFKTGAGDRLEHRAFEAEAKTKQIEEELGTKKQIEELKAIRKLLGSEKGQKTQQDIDLLKAKFDITKEEHDLDRADQAAEVKASYHEVNDDPLRAEAVRKNAAANRLEVYNKLYSNLNYTERMAQEEGLVAKIQGEKDSKKRKLLQRQKVALAIINASKDGESSRDGRFNAMKQLGIEEINDDNRLVVELRRLTGSTSSDVKQLTQEFDSMYDTDQQRQFALRSLSDAFKKAAFSGDQGGIGLIQENKEGGKVTLNWNTNLTEAEGAANEPTDYFGSKATADNIVGMGRAKKTDAGWVLNGFGNRGRKAVAAFYTGKDSRSLSSKEMASVHKSWQKAHVDDKNVGDYLETLLEMEKGMKKDGFEAHLKYTKEFIDRLAAEKDHLNDQQKLELQRIVQKAEKAMNESKK
jgi:hypothetical protein